MNFLFRVHENEKIDPYVCMFADKGRPLCWDIEPYELGIYHERADMNWDEAIGESDEYLDDVTCEWICIPAWLSLNVAGTRNVCG